MLRTIEFFEKENGQCPTEEFLDSLPLKVRQKSAAVFELIESLPMVPKKFFKKLIGIDGIWEIRVEYQSNIYRFLCFIEKNSVVILTHGFQKKTQKTPSQEIEMAQKFKLDYLKRRLK